ncbi:helix-turn-helix domain-containing protein [Pseudooceanicola spongiae]|nr:helix-turn-helix transcriptional regulator [Pseudooceanicola spongiae]
MTQRDFAEKLRQLIDEDPKLTPAGLAIKAGLSSATIRKLLSGENRNPRIDTAEKICQALGTTYEDFMREKPVPEETEILDLVKRLSPEQRRRLLGYGEALLDISESLSSTDTRARK